MWSHCERSPASGASGPHLSSPSQEDQGPEMLCPCLGIDIGSSSSLAQSLFPTSRGWHWAWASPCDAIERERMNSGTWLNFDYIISNLGKSRLSFKLTSLFPDSFRACAGPSPCIIFTSTANVPSRRHFPLLVPVMYWIEVVPLGDWKATSLRTQSLRQRMWLFPGVSVKLFFPTNSYSPTVTGQGAGIPGEILPPPEGGEKLIKYLAPWLRSCPGSMGSFQVWPSNQP